MKASFESDDSGFIYQFCLAGAISVEKLVTLLESAGELNVALQMLPLTPSFTVNFLVVGMQMEVVVVVEVTEVVEVVVAGMIEGVVAMIGGVVVVDMMAAVTAMHQSKFDDCVVVMPAGQ